MTHTERKKQTIKKLDKERSKLFKQLDSIKSKVYKLDDVIERKINKIWPDQTGIKHIERIYKRSINFSGYEP